MFNNSFLLQAIEASPKAAKARPRVASEPTLLERLPSTSVLHRDAQGTLERARLRQLRLADEDEEESATVSSSTEEEEMNDSESADTLDEEPTPSKSKFSSISESIKGRRLSLPFGQKAKEPIPWKDPQPFEVLRAVENKDLMYLMEVRDRAFHLLLRKTGDVTPLLHAMRIGTTHRDVAVVLVGALSRWVNHLDDSEMDKPRTKALLKALRTNLKLAIDYGLQSSQSDLLASFLQTLIMSEGEKWVLAQTETVGLALRVAPGEGKPVETAEAAVRAFATRELGKAAAIATLEDYVANATADLLMMAAWSLVSPGDPIPTYCFARDTRVYSIFVTRTQEAREQIAKTCTRRLKWQIKLLQSAISGRQLTFRRRVELLREEMDSGNGP